MLILSRVCAEFHNAKGEVVFAVTPAIRNLFVEAPDSIREDLLFRLLVNDGSLEATVPEARQKMLENDPAADHDASGKAVKPAKAKGSGVRSQVSGDGTQVSGDRPQVSGDDAKAADSK